MLQKTGFSLLPSLPVLLLFGSISVCVGRICMSGSVWPDSLKAEGGDGLVILTWIRTSNCFSARYTYEIGVFLNDGGDVQLLKNLEAPSNATRVVVRDLQNNANYLFNVTVPGRVPALVEGTPREATSSVPSSTPPNPTASMLSQGLSTSPFFGYFSLPDPPLTPTPTPVPRSPPPSPAPTAAPAPTPSPSPPPPYPSPQGAPTTMIFSEQGGCNRKAYSYSAPECKENTFIQQFAAQGVVANPPKYMISIQVPKKDVDLNQGPCFKHECGGSLIAPNLVLTAAHCFTKYSGWINENGNINSQFEIYAARAPVCRHETGLGRKGIIKVYMHPDYDMEVSNDVAILELLGAFDGPYINYQQAYKLVLKEAQDLYLMGYGLQYAFDGEYNRLPFVKLQMSYMPDAPCSQTLGSEASHAFVYDNMLCAYPFEGASCQGDSGSPLVYEIDKNTDVVVGINSWGDTGKCGQTKSTVYTEVIFSDIVLWIDEIVQAYGTVHGQVEWTKPPPLQG